MKKVVIFGCQQICVDFIKFLKKRNDIDISSIFTYELTLDKLYGYESVIDTFPDLNIQTPSKIDTSVVNQIKEINPDTILQVIGDNKQNIAVLEKTIQVLELEIQELKESSKNPLTN